MLWLSEQFLSDLSEICGMNLIFSVHSLLLFHCIIPFLQLSYFSIDQWFTNLTLYQSLVQASNKSCSISIVHQKQLSFHINPAIFSLLTLDSSREVSTGVTYPDKVYMLRWKAWSWHDCEFVFFCGDRYNFNMDSRVSIPLLTPFTRYLEWKLNIISSLKRQGLYELSIGLFFPRKNS